VLELALYDDRQYVIIYIIQYNTVFIYGDTVPVQLVRNINSKGKGKGEAGEP
jgi:hypothetical protein